MGSYIFSNSEAIKEMRSRRGVKELQQQTLLFIVVNLVSAAAVGGDVHGRRVLPLTKELVSGGNIDFQMT